MTGGAGYIGSKIVADLIKKYTVYIIDNLSTGHKSLVIKALFYNYIGKKN